MLLFRKIWTKFAIFYDYIVTFIIKVYRVFGKIQNRNTAFPFSARMKIRNLHFGTENTKITLLYQFVAHFVCRRSVTPATKTWFKPKKYQV